MDEAAWLTCADPGAMLEAFYRRVTGRKVRLFACACCRQVWHLLSSPLSRRVVALAEEAADRPVAPTRLDEENRLAWGAIPDAWPAPQVAAARAAAVAVAPGLGLGSVSFVLGEVRRALAPAGHDADDRLPPRGRRARRRAERERWCALIRDLAGNPWRPAALDPAWRTPLVVRMAKEIYAERAFDCLPILADALEEAGCVDVGVLDHCREGGAHARGCWVLDLILSKDR